MCFLLKKKIKEQKQEKNWTKKKRKNIVKSEEIEKGAHKERSIVVVPFALSIFLLLPFILVSIHTYFTPLFITTGARNTYRSATRTSALDIYLIYYL